MKATRSASFLIINNKKEKVKINDNLFKNSKLIGGKVKPITYKQLNKTYNMMIEQKKKKAKRRRKKCLGNNQRGVK